MNKFLLVSAVALAGPVLAQGFKTTPTLGSKSEGNHFCTMFGQWASSRYQMVDGSHTGEAFQITQISYRMDDRSHNAHSGAGRTWNKIELNISETTKYDNMSRKFADNVTGPQTKAFDSKWSWPTITGKPVLKPDMWGGSKGLLRFPFEKPWLYTGKADILMDFSFGGGIMENKGGWSWPIPFALDSAQLPAARRIGNVQAFPAKANACADSSVSLNYGAEMRVWPASHGAMAEPSLRNKLEFKHQSILTAPNSTVIHAIGFGLNSQGLDIGARCNKLFIDFSKPVFLQTMKTDSFGITPFQQILTPWRSEFANLELTLQGGWADSKRGEFSLTSAVHVTLPEGIEKSRFKVQYAPGVNPANSIVNASPSAIAFPATAYTIR